MEQQLLAVGAVLALLGAALWWLRRRGYAAASVAGGGRRIERLERLALSPQHTLHLVRVGRAVVLLACSPAGCAIVRELEADRMDGAAS